MDFFFDYIFPWLALYFILKFLLLPGAAVDFIINPPRR